MERFFDGIVALSGDQVEPAAFRSIGATVDMDVVGPPLSGTGS